MADLVDSTWGAHQLALETDLKALALPGIGENWKIRKYPWMQPDVDTGPIGFICPVQERIQREGVLGMNDIRLRCIIAVIAAANGELFTGLGDMQLWRETIFRRYHRSTVLRQYGVANELGFYVGSEIEPGIPLDAGIFTNKMYDAGYFTINSRVRLLPLTL